MNLVHACTTALTLAAAHSPRGEETPLAFRPSVYGLELPVKDVAVAERAYVEGLGFRVVRRSGEFARLEKDGLALVLAQSPSPAAAPDGAAIALNIEASDLDLALERALAAGFDAPDPEPHTIPIGRSIALVDADGHGVNLIDLRPDAGADDDTLAVFNVGLDLEAGADWEFVERLGFRVSTRAYVPDALPTEKAGAAELVLHREARAARKSGVKSAALLLGVDALEPALAALAPAGFVADAAVLARVSPIGRRAALRVPSGLRVELVERSQAQLAFERLCALEGSWEGSSTKGWVSRCEIEVIARGSAVLERSNFEAHPGETMLTVFARDGADLVLTHTCVAGNQPRLVASEIAPDRLHFTFRDGTNLASRDVGHMDEAVLTFEGPDAFRSRWSFFQGGKTSWMEDIVYRRRAPATAGDAPR